MEPYASQKGGTVFNATINKYAYCTITPINESKMSVTSVDYGKFEASLDGGPLPLDGNMDLIKAVTNHFGIKDGFRMFLQSEAPPGSGLGGSSTVIVAVISAVAEWLDLNMTNHEVANLAYVLERGHRPEGRKAGSICRSFRWLQSYEIQIGWRGCQLHKSQR